VPLLRPKLHARPRNKIRIERSAKAYAIEFESHKDVMDVNSLGLLGESKEGSK